MERPERRFWIELSYRYGIPLRQLQRQISSREFAELWAEEALEPRGPRRQEIQFARLMSLLANINRDRKTKAFKWEDFEARFGPQEAKEPMDVDRMCQFAMALTLALGGKVIPRGDNRQPGNHAQGQRRGVHRGREQGRESNRRLGRKDEGGG
jgi:hypothetical protein